MKDWPVRSTGVVASGIDTETRILGAAAELFAVRGFCGATVRDIANAAGINEVTIYRQFPAKQELCWKAFDWKMRNANVAALLVRPLTKVGSSKEHLVKFCRAALELPSIVRREW